MLIVSVTSMFTLSAPRKPFEIGSSGPSSAPNETAPRTHPLAPDGGDDGGGGGGGGGGSQSGSVNSQPEVTFFISLASLATSGASLAGFFLTSGLAWRKERRESKHSDLDLEKKKLEVDKLRMELAAKQTENAKNTCSETEA